MINFDTPKGLGYQVANTIRQFILTQSPTVRIVGFSLGDQTIFSSGNIDLVRFSAVLASLDIELDEIESYPTMSRSIDCTGVLTVGDLINNGISVTNYPSDYVLLDTMGSITITFILNKCSCPMKGMENKNLLVSCGINVKDYNIISSRALDLEVSFTVKENLNSDEVCFNVTSPSEGEIVKEAIGNIIGVLNAVI